MLSRSVVTYNYSLKGVSMEEKFNDEHSRNQLLCYYDDCVIMMT